jgi:hypothetical protein
MPRPPRECHAVTGIRIAHHSQLPLLWNGPSIPSLWLLGNSPDSRTSQIFRLRALDRASVARRNELHRRILCAFSLRKQGKLANGTSQANKNRDPRAA